MDKTIEKIVSLCKRRGFIFQSSEIYGGFGAVYDYGPLGIELKNNISQLWWQEMTHVHENIVGLDIKPEFPKKPNIVIKNDFNKSTDKLAKELLSKIKNLNL